MRIFNSNTLKGREYIEKYDDYICWDFRDKRIALPPYNIYRNLNNYTITYVGVGIKDKSKNYLKIETYKNKKLYSTFIQ